MKRYRKKGSIKAVKFTKEGYKDLINDPEKLAEQSEVLRELIKRVKHTQQGFFCASSAGLRPISDGSWLCYDEGRVFTMADDAFVGKFEEIGPEGEKILANEELLDQIQALQEELDEKTKLLDEAGSGA